MKEKETQLKIKRYPSLLQTPCSYANLAADERVLNVAKEPPSARAAAEGLRWGGSSVPAHRAGFFQLGALRCASHTQKAVTVGYPILWILTPVCSWVTTTILKKENRPTTFKLPLVGHQWTDVWPCGFGFSRMSCKWNRTVCLTLLLDHILEIFVSPKSHVFSYVFV